MNIAPKLVVFALLARSGAALAQNPELPRPSPNASVTQTVGLTEIEVKYSSPAVRDRKIWGELVPYDELWRTGANKATTVRFGTDVTVAGNAVPAGTYGVFTIPGKKEWVLILSSQNDLSGTNGYDPKKDVVRVTSKPSKIAPLERLRFVFTDTTESSTRLHLEWEKLRLTIPITTDTAARVAANIKSATEGAWRPHATSARYLLDHDQDLPEARTYAQTSVSLDANWYNLWILAQIQAKLGETAAAIASAEQALTLGDDSNAFQFYGPQMKKALQDWRKRS